MLRPARADKARSGLRDAVSTVKVHSMRITANDVPHAARANATTIPFKLLLYASIALTNP